MESRLREMTRKMIREMTTTGDASGYEVPGAFRKRGQKNKRLQKLLKGGSLEGFTVAKEIE